MVAAVTLLCRGGRIRTKMYVVVSLFGLRSTNSRVHFVYSKKVYERFHRVFRKTVVPAHLHKSKHFYCITISET